MINKNLNSNEVEQDRQAQANEFAEELGDGWAEANRPGTFGCHELLDRTALLSNMLEQYVLTHPACVARPEWYLLAERSAAALRELYQQVGADHLEDEKPS